MTKWKKFFVLIGVLLAGAGWAETKILYLTNGDTLEGEIVDETDERLSLRLNSGVTISLGQNEIESIETAKSISEMEEDLMVEPQAPVPDIDLRDVFHSVNPTPTPIPIKRLGSLRIQKKFRAKEFRETLLPKNLGKEEAPIRNLPQIPEEDEAGNRNFGVITYFEPGPKIREGAGGWSPLASNQLLNPGDEINTLEGRAEITTQKGNLIRLEPNSHIQLERGRCVLSRGKIWVVTYRQDPETIDFGGASLKLQQEGLMHLETLRSGHKISLLEGKIRVHNQPEAPRLLKSMQAPNSIWVDAANTLTSDKEIESVLSARWEDWQRRVMEYSASQPTALEDFVGSSEGDAEPAKALILELAGAVSRYHMDHGRFPEPDAQALLRLVQDTGDPQWRGPYLEGAAATLKDPWGGNIIYKLIEDGNEPIAGIYLTGSNQKFEEGEGDDLGILVPPPDVTQN